MSDFYKLTPLDSKGQPFPFKQLEGKTVLIVNVASKCGFTKQYEGLEALYQKYKDRNFEIIGFPCNQFGSQESGSDADIQTFCSLTWGVSFPVLKKIEVNGDGADPVYKYLKSRKSGLLGMSRIKWNFEKFLVDGNGKVVERWASTTTPEGLQSDINKYLSA